MGYGVHEEFESRNRDKKSVSCVYTSNRRLIDKRINRKRGGPISGVISVKRVRSAFGTCECFHVLHVTQYYNK